MTYNIFRYNNTIVGKEYGIQVHSDELVKVFRIIFKAIKYHKMPMTSHHGNVFNLAKLYNLRFKISDRQNKLLVIFERKHWTTDLDEHFNADNHESYLTLEQKNRLKGMLECAGAKVIESWNDTSYGNSVSIVVDLEFPEFKEICKDEEIEEYVNVLNSFDISRRD